MTTLSAQPFDSKFGNPSMLFFDLGLHYTSNNSVGAPFDPERVIQKWYTFTDEKRIEKQVENDLYMVRLQKKWRKIYTTNVYLLN